MLNVGCDVAGMGAGPYAGPPYPVSGPAAPMMNPPSYEQAVQQSGAPPPANAPELYAKQAPYNPHY